MKNPNLYHFQHYHPWQSQHLPPKRCSLNSQPRTKYSDIDHLNQLNFNSISQQFSRQEPDKGHRRLGKVKGRSQCWDPRENNADNHDSHSGEDEYRCRTTLNDGQLCCAKQVHDESLGEESIVYCQSSRLTRYYCAGVLFTHPWRNQCVWNILTPCVSSADRIP